MVVLHVVLSLEPGGTERLVVDMSNRLAEQGVQVHVCCLDAAGALAEGLHRRVAFHVLGRPPRFSVRLAWRLGALARKVRATVLHCHQYTPFVYGCAARLFAPGIGMVFTEHGRLAGAVPSPRRRAINRWLTRIGGQQFAVSHELRAYMLDEGFAPGRLGVIHNGIEPGPASTQAERRRAREALGLCDDDLVVGTTARFDPVKDLPNLVAGAALAHDDWPALKLVMIGDGACRPQVEEAARSRGFDNVRLPGHLGNARSLLAAFDVYVNCSLSEGISVALLEAMDAGLPVVATAVGGTPEIVRAGTDGILVPPGAPRAGRCAARPRARREAAARARDGGAVAGARGVFSDCDAGQLRRGVSA
jgi:glycosyltransferase involved in cell wall biosynthesis